MAARFRNRCERRRRRAANPQVEGFEGRLLMSIAPIGSEFRANTYTAGDQQTATLFANGLPDSTAPVAAAGAAGSVITWTSLGQDGSSWGVYAQRFDPGGSPQGGEFRVNTTTSGEQRHPTVAMAGDGRFVVAWSSLGQDGSGFGIYGQRYDAAGRAVGAEFRVNSYTNNHQVYPAIAMAADGSFAVTWTSLGQDGSSNGVYLQRYDASGHAQGGEIRVNSTTAGDQQNSTIAMAADGRSVVTWWSGDGSGWGIFAQRFDASGQPSGREVRVNSYASSNQAFSAVAMAPDGRYVVTWSSYGQDGSGNGVYARRYDPTGQFLGNEFRVNTTTVGEQTYPSVAMDADGRFAIAWSSLGQDGSGWGVYLRLYEASGDSDGLEVRANSFTVNHQVLPSIAMGAGRALVAWTSLGQDGSGNGVYGQRFRYDAPPQLPASLIVDDTSVVEGNSGTTNAAFTVHLVTPATQTVTVDYVTGSDVARDGSDFLGVRGTLTFAPGETTKTVNVPVLGDTVTETDETFYLNLANPTNAQILRGRAVGTIRNDDEALPRLSIDDVTVVEGNSGTTDAVFTVRLSAASTHQVSVGYYTNFGTASAPSDFDTTSGTLVFTPGETTLTIVVPVHGDTAVEPDETFYVELVNPVYATITSGHAVGTIRNDDQATHARLLTVGDAGLTVRPSTASTQPVAVRYTTTDDTTWTNVGYGTASTVRNLSPAGAAETDVVPVQVNTTHEADKASFADRMGTINATPILVPAVGPIQNGARPPTRRTQLRYGTWRAVNNPQVSGLRSPVSGIRNRAVVRQTALDTADNLPDRRGR